MIGAISQQASKVAAADLTKSLDSLKGTVGGALGGALDKPAAGGGVGDQLRGVLGR